jgi:type III secretion system low calcium response chaperone LcrH/SycD
MSTTPEHIDTLLPDIDADDFAEIMSNFINNGKTIRELKGLSADNMEAVYAVAYNAYNGGNYPQARKMFEFLCYFDHLEKKYWMALGACRQMQKEYKEAIDAYSFATLLDADDPRPPLHAADCHIALGNRDAAISGLTAASEWSGDSAEFQPIRHRAETLLVMLEQTPASASGHSDRQGA